MEAHAEPGAGSICGAVKLVPTSLYPVPGAPPGTEYVAMTCVRAPLHPENDASAEVHICGTFTWQVGPGDDYRETPEYAAEPHRQRASRRTDRQAQRRAAREAR